MMERIFQGIMNNMWIVSISLTMLIGGTIGAYRKFGLKRVLLGKKNDDRELIYKRGDGSIIWKDTLKTWGIIVTGGMSLLSLFLLIMLIGLSFIYQHDMKSTRDNDNLLCEEFGTIYPTEDQLYQFNSRPKTIEIQRDETGNRETNS